MEQGIDVIIPVFKIKNLEKSLDSLPFTDLIKVTIVDDGQKNDYSQILAKYKDKLNIQILQLEENIGQGKARQIGVDKTEREFIFFLDCGDLLYNKNTLQEMYEVFKTNKNICFTENKCRIEVLDGSIEEATLCILGNLYRREFLNYYSIRFSNDDFASKNFEDIPIRFLCLSCKECSARNVLSYQHKNVSCIKLEDAESISNKNDGEYNYKKRSLGFAINFVYCLEALDKLKNDGKIIYSEEKRRKMFAYGLVNQYAIYKKIKDFKEEFIKEAIEGLNYFLVFYKKNKMDFKNYWVQRIFYEIFENVYSCKVLDLESEYKIFIKEIGKWDIS